MHKREEQIERLYPRMLGLVARTLDYDSASDVVQSAIVEILELDEHKQTTDSWILRLIASRTLNYIRDNTRRAERERGFLDETHGDNTLNPEAELLRKEMVDRLSKALLTLPVEDYRLIANRFGAGLYKSHTIRELSAKFHVPRSTLQDKIETILRTLRERLL